MGAEGARGRGRLRDQAGGGCSLKRKRLIQASFWFSDPMVRPDPVFSSFVFGWLAKALHLGSAANVRRLLRQAKGSGRY